LLASIPPDVIKQQPQLKTKTIFTAQCKTDVPSFSDIFDLIQIEKVTLYLLKDLAHAYYALPTVYFCKVELHQPITLLKITSLNSAMYVFQGEQFLVNT
jgi:hypothetical protein